MHHRPTYQADRDEDILLPKTIYQIMYTPLLDIHC